MSTPPKAPIRNARKPFDNEWVFQVFEDQPSFFTKRMFGGLAAYLFGRLMMVLVEPTRTGRWKWHGVMICTDHARHAAIIDEFPQLEPHGILKKWLYIDTRHDDFESTMQSVADAMARDDRRFGVQPASRARSGASKKIFSRTKQRPNRRTGPTR